MTETQKSRLGLLLGVAYVLLAVAAIAFVFFADDGLAGVLAVLVIQPWGSVLVWLMDITGMDSFLFNVLFMLAGALLNGWLIYRIISWLAALLRR